MSDKSEEVDDRIDWSIVPGIRKDFRERSSVAFLILCVGIGVLALLTPIILGLIGEGEHISISHYYHDASAGDAFVGMLCATGLFLFFYRGLSAWENLLLSLAGIFLVLVALVPTGIEQCPEETIQSAGISWSWHGIFAVSFFLCLFVVSAFFSKNRLGFILWPPLRKRLKALYVFFGISMLALPICVFLYYQFFGPDCGREIFWAEAFAIWAFSGYWFTKSYEYMILLGLKLSDFVDWFKARLAFKMS